MRAQAEQLMDAGKELLSDKALPEGVASSSAYTSYLESVTAYLKQQVSSSKR